MATDTDHRVRVTAELWQRLQALSVAHHRTEAGEVREALTEYCNRHEAKQAGAT